MFISSIDNEREAQKQRKSNLDFKKQRRQNYLKKKSRNKSELSREGVTYESGIALNLDTDILKRATVTSEKLKEFEKYVPTASYRLSKKYITCPADDLSSQKFCLSYTTPKQAVVEKKQKLYSLPHRPKEARHLQDLHYRSKTFLHNLCFQGK